MSPSAPDPLARLLDTEGRLLRWPTKQAEKLAALAYLAEKFERGQSYHEREINGILKQWHLFSDWPLLRRELYQKGFFDRNPSGSEYRRSNL